MMARLGVAGLVAGWLLASGLGLGCARLDAQGREALVAQGQQLFTDKGCYGCHTIGAAGTPIAPDLRARGRPVSGRDPGALAARSVCPGTDPPHAEPAVERGRGQCPRRLPGLAPLSRGPEGGLPPLGRPSGTVSPIRLVHVEGTLIQVPHPPRHAAGGVNAGQEEREAITSGRRRPASRPRSSRPPPVCAGGRRRPRPPSARIRCCSSRPKILARAGPRQSRSSGNASANACLRPIRERPGPQLRQLVAQVPGLRQ